MSSTRVCWHSRYAEYLKGQRLSWFELYMSSMSINLLHPPWQYSYQTCRGRQGQGGGNTYQWATHTLTPHTRDHTQTLQESVCFLPCSFGGANWSELDGDMNQPEGFLQHYLVEGSEAAHWPRFLCHSRNYPLISAIWKLAYLWDGVTCPVQLVDISMSSCFCGFFSGTDYISNTVSLCLTYELSAWRVKYLYDSSFVPQEYITQLGLFYLYLYSW